MPSLEPGFISSAGLEIDKRTGSFTIVIMKYYRNDLIYQTLFIY